jgi:hypothetical protein
LRIAVKRLNLTGGGTARNETTMILLETAEKLRLHPWTSNVQLTGANHGPATKGAQKV